ncbi:MAG: hypothetical protein M3680_11735 [Myxococcota bacterium]|nr:hypothetical protein [Myxococcota bacterium]
MKASKFIVLAGGILGILAFFLPMVSVERGGTRVTASAFQVVQGLDAVATEVDRAEVRTVAASYGTSGRAALSEAKSDLGAIKGIVLAIFAPALLLALIGGLAVRRGQFGRVAGTLSLLLGAVGLAIGVILKGAAEGDSGVGLTVLLLTGLAGVVGGILALAKPERRLVVARA